MRPRGPNECWPWLGAVNERGYPIKEYCGRTMPAQRCFWLQWFGPIPAEFVVSTKCGDPACMNPSHWRCVHQTTVQAEARGYLTPGDVQDIRRRRDGRTRHEAGLLAAKYQVSDSTIYRIWTGKTWPRVRRPHRAGEAIVPPKKRGRPRKETSCSSAI